MTELQLEGLILLTIVLAAPLATVIPCLCRYGVETGGYRYLCLTLKGAERLAACAEAEGRPAEIVRIR